MLSQVVMQTLCNGSVGGALFCNFAFIFLMVKRLLS